MPDVFHGCNLRFDDTIISRQEDEIAVGKVILSIPEAYRTITFLEPPTGDLLAWLQVNAVKQ